MSCSLLAAFTYFSFGVFTAAAITMMACTIMLYRESQTLRNLSNADRQASL